MKPITLIHVPCSAASDLYRATSRRFGVTAYGRTVQEAKRRLFVTTAAESTNRALSFIATMRSKLVARREPL